MYATYPIYYPSARWARENGEIDLWRESFKINKECRDFVNANAAPAYHNNNPLGFIKNLTETFGLERAMFVIGRFIVAADGDKRYDYLAVERAKQINFADMKEGQARYEAGQDPDRTTDHTRDLHSNVHPVILNVIFRYLMRMEQEQINLPSDDLAPDNEQDEGAEQ